MKMHKKKTNTGAKEKLISATGSISGIASIMGSWQVCHSICLAIISVLAVLGITVAGMPLAFLTTLAIPFWTIAFLLLLVLLSLHHTKKCISGNTILFNSGLIIAGIPFQQVQAFQPAFWTIGGIMAGMSIIIFIKNKTKRWKK